MLSIENFYYVLYQQLLNPLGIHDLIYREFGSVDSKKLCYGHYSNMRLLYRHGAAQFKYPWCYFFDQEPLNVASVDSCFLTDHNSNIKLLANSEHSSLKTQILKKNNYLDWYFFFHGFAALDWFRDARFFKADVEWNKPYISMNRLYANDRSYRLNLVVRLHEQHLQKDGYISLHLHNTDHGTWQDEIANPYTKLSAPARALIYKMFSETSEPLIIDQVESHGDLSAGFGINEHNLWQRGFWHVVTETVFYHNKLHLTEKIFKPIVSKRPFMLAAAPGNLAYLKSYGFQTFDKWIDESYDNIQDSDQRLQAIVDQVKILCKMPRSQLKHMHQDMQHVLDYNFDHMWTGFRTQIVNELVDNFETCVRIWNNGRVDSKSLPLHRINLEQVKKLLLV
jgi:hypothetical protein